MEQFTASEVRRQASTFGSGRVNAMLNAYADMLEAQEKAVPMAWRTFDGEGNYDYRDYENNEHYRDWYVSRNGAKYANWVEPLYTHPAPADAERLAEALREFDGAFHKELADLTRIPEDDRGRINRLFAMDCVVGLRRCWDKLSTSRNANSAQAQPPAARVPTMRFFIGGPRACAYVDKFEHVEAVITALCKCTGDARDDYTSTDLLASERVR